MIEKKISIHDYDFYLKINEQKIVTACTFTPKGKRNSPMNEEQLRQGHELQNAIFNGDWDWLVFANDTIRLSEFHIEIHLKDIEWDGSIRWGGARLLGGQKEICTHCNDPLCDWDCCDALEWANDRDPEICVEKSDELQSNRKFNYAMDALEALILSHAQAGVDVTSNIYLEGYRTAVDAVNNNV